MILSTIFKYELKKLFCAKVNLIAIAGSVIILVFLAVSMITGDMPVSREAAKELDGRAIDGQLIEEMKPALRYEKGRNNHSRNHCRL